MDFLPRSVFSAVEIEINSACNKACSYCPNALFPPRRTGEMDPSLFESLLGQLSEIAYDGRVSFHFYNEPLLHSDLESVVRKTRRILPVARIELYTNGTLLSEERLKRLHQEGVSRFIVTPPEDAVDSPVGHFLGNLPLQTRESVILRDVGDLRLTNRGGLLKNLGPEGLPLTSCRISEFLCVITAEGSVLPCFEDFLEQMKMGNLKEERLIEIWNSERYRRFRAELARGLRHLHPCCRFCNRTEVLPKEPAKCT